MSEKKRFYKFLDDKQEWVIRDRTNRRQDYRVGRNKRYTEKLVDLLNELSDENGQLRKQVAEYDMILRQHEFAEKEGFR